MKNKKLKIKNKTQALLNTTLVLGGMYIGGAVSYAMESIQLQVNQDAPPALRIIAEIASDLNIPKETVQGLSPETMHRIDILLQNPEHGKDMVRAFLSVHCNALLDQSMKGEQEKVLDMLANGKIGIIEELKNAFISLETYIGLSKKIHEEIDAVIQDAGTDPELRPALIASIVEHHSVHTKNIDADKKMAFFFSASTPEAESVDLMVKRLPDSVKKDLHHPITSYLDNTDASKQGEEQEWLDAIRNILTNHLDHLKNASEDAKEDPAHTTSIRDVEKLIGAVDTGYTKKKLTDKEEWESLLAKFQEKTGKKTEDKLPNSQAKPEESKVDFGVKLTKASMQTSTLQTADTFIKETKEAWGKLDEPVRNKTLSTKAMIELTNKTLKIEDVAIRMEIQALRNAGELNLACYIADSYFLNLAKKKNN